VSKAYTSRIQKRNCNGPILSIGSQSTFQYLNTCKAAINASLISNSYPTQQPDFVLNLPTSLVCHDSAQPSTYGVCNGNSSRLGYSQATCNA
jgi:hypothetical protein